jgi:hypothetical protein
MDYLLTYYLPPPQPKYFESKNFKQTLPVETGGGKTYCYENCLYFILNTATKFEEYAKRSNLPRYCILNTSLIEW